VDRSELVDGAVDQSFDIGLDADIADHTTSRVAEVSHGRVDCIGLEVADHDPPTLGDEPARGGAADSRCAACEGRDLACEPSLAGRLQGHDDSSPTTALDPVWIPP